jgi:monothiol glutaredoxin
MGVDLKEKVQELIRDNEVLLFMKGTPDAPQCGFSMRVVGVLESIGVE